MVISRNAFAKLLNVSQPCVSKYVKAGMPTTDGGVDHDAAMTWVRSHVTPQAGIHSHKGADRAYELLRDGDQDAALAACEAVLAPVVSEIYSECARLGAHVADLVKGMDDPKKIAAVARREAREMLMRLTNGNFRSLEVGHE